MDCLDFFESMSRASAVDFDVDFAVGFAGNETRLDSPSTWISRAQRLSKPNGRRTEYPGKRYLHSAYVIEKLAVLMAG